MTTGAVQCQPPACAKTQSQPQTSPTTGPELDPEEPNSMQEPGPRSRLERLKTFLRLNTNHRILNQHRFSLHTSPFSAWAPLHTLLAPRLVPSSRLDGCRSVWAKHSLDLGLT